ncbi:hypothetical protein KEM56_003499, partial [Ascosphaera pollenicola]
IRSTWAGWGSLCVAAGGAYYFAKRNINANRAERHEAVMRAKQEAVAAERAAMQQQQQQRVAAKTSASATEDDVSGHPSMEVQDTDPAPTRHEPDTAGQKAVEKGKYEAEEVWRSKKGPRLS